MKRLLAILTLGISFTNLSAMPESIPSASVAKDFEKTELFLRKLDVAEISTGKIYIFEFGSARRLKEITSGDSFIGVKKNRSKVVDFYVDSNKLPLTVATQLKDVDGTMPMQERLRIGKLIHSRIFKLAEDKDKITVEFNSTPIEIGSAQ